MPQPFMRSVNKAMVSISLLLTWSFLLSAVTAASPRYRRPKRRALRQRK